MKFHKTMGDSETIFKVYSFLDILEKKKPSSNQGRDGAFLPEGIQFLTKEVTTLLPDHVGFTCSERDNWVLSNYA